MQRDSDSTDIPTLRQELKLQKSPTLSVVYRHLSVKCRQNVVRSVSKVSVRGVKLGEREVSVKERGTSQKGVL